MRRLCFYTCPSVILFTGAGVPGQVHPPSGTRYTPWAGTPPRAGTSPGQIHSPGRDTPWAGTLSPPPGQVHPLGRYIPWAGTPPEQVHPWAGTPSPPLGEQRWLLQRTVRILLECILVLFTKIKDKIRN